MAFEAIIEVALGLMEAGAETKTKGGCIFTIIVLLLTIGGFILYFNYTK
tara:strand:+ start:496 stop:642 length:147 start_codon:yes stop_codon:yes gene_type:complete